MTATISTLSSRVETLLWDAGNLVWDDAILTEALRLALGEYNLAAVAPVTLTGLDGAALTTLPTAHESLIVLGAAGYAASARVADSASAAWVEGFEPNQSPAALQTWAENRLAEFRWMLRNVFPTYQQTASGTNHAAEATRLADLHTAATPPWSAWEEQ